MYGGSPDAETSWLCVAVEVYCRAVVQRIAVDEYGFSDLTVYVPMSTWRSCRCKPRTSCVSAAASRSSSPGGRAAPQQTWALEPCTPETAQCRSRPYPPELS